MEFNFVFVLCLLLSVSWVTSNPTISKSERYWKSELPNTPIPENIIDLLPSAGSSEQIWNSNRATAGEGGITTISPKAMTCCFCNYHVCFAKAKAHPDPAFVFFTQQELHRGSTMTLDLTRSTNPLPFLSKSVAESIPFSLNNLPEILNRFSVAPSSLEAKVLKNTVQQCEAAKENTVCATSLESMADFIKTKLGNDVTIISTEAKGRNKVQSYRIVEVVRKEEGEETKPLVSCHKVSYAYAVFYCHKAQNIRSYAVRLVGEDETQLTAVAVCHTNASEKKDGKQSGAAICHFLPEGHFLVYNNNN